MMPPPFAFMTSSRPTDRFNQEAGLYVGDIDEAVSLEQLYLKFKEFGPIQYIKLHRYPFLGISKNFAFVYFATSEQSSKAKDAMNHQMLLRRPLRITTLKHYDREANLFFSGFLPETTLTEVEQFFSKYGTIVSVQFSYDDSKRSRGYGWVQFEEKQASDQVLVVTAGDLSYKENKITVTQFVKKGRSKIVHLIQQDGREDKKNNIYVNSFWKPLEQDVDFKQVEGELIKALESIFSQFGQIGSIFVKVDNIKKAPFAFVSFIDPQSARNAISHFSRKKLYSIQKFQNSQGMKDPFSTGKNIYVNWAQNKSERKRQFEGTISDRYIFLQNLKQDIFEDQLRSALAVYGEIQMIRLDRMMMPMMQSRIGYVVFRQAMSAARLIKNYFQNADLMALFEHHPIVCNLFEPSWKKRVHQQKYKIKQSRFNQQQQPRGFQSQRQGPFPQMAGQPFQLGPPFLSANRQFPLGPPMQRFYNGPPVPPQIIPTEQKNIAYDQRSDLLNLLKNIVDFKALNEQEQRRQLGLMLKLRIKEKRHALDENTICKVIGMLIDESNFTVDEILELLKSEQEINDRLDEADQMLAEEKNQ